MCKRSLIPISLVLLLGLAGISVGQPTGEILFEYWMNIGGGAVGDLTGKAAYPDNPDDGELRAALEGKVDWADNYGTRVRGYLYPPGDGDYTFWISGDDFIELYLSTDADPANAALIANVPGWTSYLQWDKYPEQMSQPVTLAAGQKYYIEVLHKEGGGGDSVTAAWAGPGIGTGVDLTVIGGAYLSPADWAPGLKVARNPNPADGAVDVDIASLEWTAGKTAVSHDVYLSKDATIDAADLIGQPTATLQVAILDPGVTYYWRVDEVEADGTVREGAVWTFSTLPREAHFPSPGDGDTNIVTTQLGWTPGKGAILQTVFFGTNPAGLAPLKVMTLDTTADPGPLQINTTYYWRVDTVIPVPVPGPVWSFSTMPIIDTVEDPNLLAHYTCDDGEGSHGVVDSSGHNYHGSIDGGPVNWVTGAVGGAIEFLGDNQGYVEMPIVPVTAAKGSVFMWINTTQGNSANNDEGMLWWASLPGGGDGYGGESEIHLTIDDPGQGELDFFIEDDPSGGDREVNYDNIGGTGWRHVGATWDVTDGIKLYVDGFLVDEDSHNGATYGFTTMRLGRPVATGNGNRYYQGMMDDVMIYDYALSEEQVRQQFADTAIPYKPDPVDGTGGLSASGIVLSWTPGDGAETQDVYVGTDLAAVTDANTSDTTGIYRGRQAETTYTVEDASWDATHYWRVDQVAADGSIATGPIWSFVTVEAIPMDNWKDATASAGAAYMDTFVKNGPYDVGALSGDITYEFIVRSNPAETQTSMALIGRIGHGDTRAALKYEQWSNTGNYGATVFGVMDYDYGVANDPGADTHLVFVSSEAAGTTDLYVNGKLAGSVPTAITLAGIVGIGQAIRDPEGAAFIDDFDGDIFGVAIYDRALTAAEVALNSDALTDALVDLSSAGDVVQGVPNDGDWPGAEVPANVLDNNSATKYLHFKGGAMATGVQIETAKGATVIKGLGLTTANDDYGRDPTSFELSGSNDSINGPYTVIASGQIADLAQAAVYPRFTRTSVYFLNDVAYKYYQLVFPTLRAGNDGKMQIAEIELLGDPLPVARWEFDGDFVGTGPAAQVGIPNGAIAFEDDSVMGTVLSLPGGDNQFVDCGGVGISGNDATTITVWAKADNTSIPDWTLIFGFTGDAGGNGGNGSHFNIGSLGGPGGVGAHCWGWEETIFSDAEALEWHHYAMTYDGRTILYYGDGAPKDTDPGKSNVRDLSIRADRVHVGSRITQASSFPGKVDDARVYNETLTPGAIAKIAAE